MSDNYNASGLGGYSTGPTSGGPSVNPNSVSAVPLGSGIDEVSSKLTKQSESLTAIKERASSMTSLLTAAVSSLDSIRMQLSVLNRSGGTSGSSKGEVPKDLISKLVGEKDISVKKKEVSSDEDAFVKTAALKYFLHELGLGGPIVSALSGAFGGLTATLGPVGAAAVVVSAGLKELDSVLAGIYKVQTTVVGNFAQAGVDVTNAGLRGANLNTALFKAVGISAEDYLKSMELAVTHVPEFTTALQQGSRDVEIDLDTLARGAGMGSEAFNFAMLNARSFGKGMVSTKESVAEMQVAAKAGGYSFMDLEKNTRSVVDSYRPYVRGVHEVTEKLSPFEAALYEGSMSMGTFTSMMFGYTSMTLEQTAGVVAKLTGLKIEMPKSAGKEVADAWKEITSLMAAGQATNAQGYFDAASKNVEGFSEAVRDASMVAGDKVFGNKFTGELDGAAKQFTSAANAARLMPEIFKSKAEGYEFLNAASSRAGVGVDAFAASAVRAQLALNESLGETQRGAVSPLTAVTAIAKGVVWDVVYSGLKTFSSGMGFEGAIGVSESTSGVEVSSGKGKVKLPTSGFEGGEVVDGLHENTKAAQASYAAILSAVNRSTRVHNDNQVSFNQGTGVRSI